MNNRAYAVRAVKNVARHGLSWPDHGPVWPENHLRHYLNNQAGRTKDPFARYLAGDETFISGATGLLKNQRVYTGTDFETYVGGAVLGAIVGAAFGHPEGGLAVPIVLGIADLARDRKINRQLRALAQTSVDQYQQSLVAEVGK